jgi:mRNA interferase MazF
MEYSRGDIVTINFNPTKGHEVGKIRPAVILSHDDENSILDTIVVAPLSTQLIDNMLPFRFRVSKRESLEKDSDLLLNQIRTISKKRVGEKLAKLGEDEYSEIRKNLCKMF